MMQSEDVTATEARETYISEDSNAYVLCIWQLCFMEITPRPWQEGVKAINSDIKQRYYTDWPALPSVKIYGNDMASIGMRSWKKTIIGVLALQSIVKL